MPIYEYECRKCGQGFEVLVRSSSDLPSRCPECGAPKPKKAFSAFAVAAGGGKDEAACAEGCPASARGKCPGGSCPFSD